MVVWSQKLVNCDSTFSLDEQERPFHLISLFHSVTLSASHSFFALALNLFCYPISLSHSLFVSQTPFPLTQVHTFLPHLLSISPLVHFLSPALNSSFSPFILSIRASFLIFPIWFSLFAGTTPLSPFASLSLSLSHLSVYLPPFLTLLFILLFFCPPLLSWFTMRAPLLCHPTIQFFIPSFVNSLLSKFGFLKQSKPQVEF